jgi:cytochrome P450
LTHDDVTTQAPALYYDPYDAEIDAHPHAVWRRLRDEAPLYYNDRHDFYALSRFDDVLAASSDWRTYSSARGTVLEMIDTGPEGAPPPPDGEGGFGLMIFMDPPAHDHLRRLVSRAFTPRRVAERETRIRELCAQSLDPQIGGAGFDYLEDFAAKIPTMVIGSLLGMAPEVQEELRIWGDLLMRYEPDGPSPEKAAAVANLYGYIERVIEERQQKPRDDMVSDLLAAEVEIEDGTVRRLNAAEALGFVGLLELAGSETTARLLGWTAVLLARHPEERAKLVADPALIPNAVEELLRYEAPSPIQARFVTEDVEWYGQTLPAGSKVALLTGSAGRDERAFPDPDRLDVTRQFDRHITFGYGIHYCLGANLARLEARVVLEETLRRFPEWEVDESAIELVRTSTVRGPIHVPISL